MLRALRWLKWAAPPLVALPGLLSRKLPHLLSRSQTRVPPSPPPPPPPPTSPSATPLPPLRTGLELATRAWPLAAAAIGLLELYYVQRALSACELMPTSQLSFRPDEPACAVLCAGWLSCEPPAAGWWSRALDLVAERWARAFELLVEWWWAAAGLVMLGTHAEPMSALGDAQRPLLDRPLALTLTLTLTLTQPAPSRRSWIGRSHRHATRPSTGPSRVPCQPSSW